jgi:putative intracellular protease/amidase
MLGPGAADDTVPPDVVSLVQFLAPRLFEKPNGYVMSVCTGSWILAQAGVLDGHCATTNKAAFKQIKVR